MPVKILIYTDVWLATSFERKRVFEMKGERDIERKIRGTIFPVEWDENNNVARVVIDTPDQDGYLIERNTKGKELLDFIRREVEVSGTMREDEGGNLSFKVKEYSLIKG
jgi:hypothetical protein